MDRYCATIDILKKDIENNPEIKKEIKLTFYEPEGDLYDKELWEEDSPIANFRDIYALNGRFEELEKLLIKLKIPFDRWTEAYNEGPIIAWYRPDINPQNCIYGDGDYYEPVYPASKIKEIAKGINISDAATNDETLQDIELKFLMFLQKIPEIKPLEELEKEQK